MAPRSSGATRFKARTAALALATGILALPAAADEPRAAYRYPLPEDVRREAANLLGAMRGGDPRQMAVAVRNLVALRSESQVSGFTPVAAAFVGAYPRAMAGVPPSVARDIASDAVALAPDYPPLRFLLARAELSTGFEGIGRAAAATIDGLSAMLRYPRGTLTHVANVAFYLIGAFLVVATVVGLMLMVRHLPQLAHDIGDLFPQSRADSFSLSEVARSRKALAVIGAALNRVLGRLVVTLVLVLPLALGAGLLASTVFFVVVVAAYSRRAEVAGGFLVLVAVAAVPVLGTMSRASSLVEETDGAAFWACIREHCDDARLERARRRVVEDPRHTWARLAVASREIREGHSNPMRLAAAALHLEAAAPDRDGVVATTLGNVQVMRALADCHGGKVGASHLAGASRAYETATGTRARRAALRGLAIAQGLAGDRGRMEDALKDLVAATTDEDLSFVARIRTLTTTSEACPNAAALAGLLEQPRLPDWSIYLGDVEPANLALTIPFPDVLAGRLPVAALPVVAASGLAAMLLMVLVRGRLRLAYACPRCGTVSCAACNLHASGFDYCPTCLLEQVRPAFLDPLDLVAIQSRQDSQRGHGRLLVPLLGLLAPGAGQVAGGRPVRGIVMLTLLASAVTMALIPVPPNVDPGAYAGQPEGLPLFPPVALALVYCWSALDVWLHRSR